MGSGYNIAGSHGAALGAKKERKAYQRAQELMKKLQAEATVTQEKIDPYSEYRQEMANMLYGYVTGTRDIKTDPGYKFTMNEAMNQTNRAGAAKGYGRSGNVLASLQQRASDIASNQYNTILSRLTDLAGATAQNAIAGGQAYGSMMQAGIMGQAQARIGESAAQSREFGAWGHMIDEGGRLAMDMIPYTSIMKNGMGGSQEGGGGQGNWSGTQSGSSANSYFGGYA